MKDITLEDLANLCEREMMSRDLEKLPDGLIQDVCKFLENLKLEVKRKDGLERSLAERQLTEAIRLLETLYSLRATKSVLLLLTGRKPQNLMETERQKLLEIDRLLHEIKESMISEEGVAIKIPGECVRKLVVFRFDIPQKIVGVDGKIYGPFKAGDIANLPKENAEILIERRFAEEILVS